ncbi:tetratricopeptide repeat protein [Aquisphaera insulae]|uniref:tetratricopeptide repeat protein n=1 Tax=Aquisphaera insulae TaxID=2712864 RepID=UPI0013EA7A4D|nr:tetratricopeptide repeat protein [Aquisphaera insulae]
MNGDDLKKLHQAILGAFDEAGLRQILRFRLDLDLDQIVGPGPFSTRVFNLLQYAIQQGSMPDLIAAVAAERPRRDDIQELFRTFTTQLATRAGQQPGDDKVAADYERVFHGEPAIDVQRSGASEGVVPARAPGLERTIRADLGFFDAAIWSRNLQTAQGQVCRVELNGPTPTMGTGFLVGPDLLLTCYHVLETVILGKSPASAVRFLFDYAREGAGGAAEGIQVGLSGATGAGKPWLIGSAPYSEGEKKGNPDSPPPVAGEYDYALVRLDREIGNEVFPVTQSPRGWVEVPQQQPALEGLAYLMILQHPKGLPLKLAMDTEPRVEPMFGGLRVRYAINTEAGSSGSPVFDKDWRLVALHHYGDPEWGHPKYNQGIPIGLIRTDLASRVGLVLPAAAPKPPKLLAASEAIEAVSKAIEANPSIGRDELDAVVVSAMRAPAAAPGPLHLSRPVRDVIDRKLDAADRQLAGDLEKSDDPVPTAADSKGQLASVNKPCNIPLRSIGRRFKGRDQFLANLRAQLGSPDVTAAAIVTTLALHGLGGVGKTRAAVEYAWRQIDDYAALLFVASPDGAELRANLAGLAKVLGVSSETAPAEERLSAVLAWLEANRGWLLILDNVDTEEAAKEVEKTLPRLRQGHVLITSRVGNFSPAVAPLEIDVLDQLDGVSFLLERTPRRRQQPDDPDRAAAIADELGGLALALEQAGAYIEKKRLSLAEYLRQWEEKRREVLAWHDERLMGYPASVAVTWETTFAQLAEAERRLLDVLSWLAADPVPLFLIESGPLVEALSEPREALAGLMGYSLARYDATGEAVLVHRLVQEVTRGRIPKADREETLVLALLAVNDVAQDDSGDVRTWDTWALLAAHADVVSRHADEYKIAEPTSRLMRDLGMYFYRRGRHLVAESLMRRSLVIIEARYGPNHPRVAIGLNNLATLLQDTDRVAEAEPLMRRALAIDEAIYGPDHPRVAIGLNNLAALLRDTDRMAEAEPLMRRALAIDEASHRPDYSRLSKELNNLAALLRNTNRLAEAEPLMRRALQFVVRIQGRTADEHPRLRTAVDNYMSLLEAMGKSPQEVEQQFRAVIEAVSRDAPSPAT